MNIALDYDDTFTRDPAVWSAFVKDASCSGHDIRFVTFRSEGAGGNEDILADAYNLAIPVIFTSGRRKRLHCYELGFIVHVWIDDMPELIVEEDYNERIPQQLINLALEEN
jgi:hypothetical protein